MGLKAKPTTTVKKTKPAARPAKRATPVRKASAGKTSAAKKSATTGKTVDAYVAALPAGLREAAVAVRRAIRDAAPGAKESIKWGQPVYEHTGPFAYFRGATKHLTLGFWRGADLPDPQGVLEGEGDRMAHMKLASAAEVDSDLIGELVRAAVDLNQRQGDPTKMKSVRKTVSADHTGMDLGDESTGETTAMAVPADLDADLVESDDEPAEVEDEPEPAGDWADD